MIDRQPNNMAHKDDSSWDERPDDARLEKDVGLCELWRHAFEIDRVLTQHRYGTSNLKDRGNRAGQATGKLPTNPKI